MFSDVLPAKLRHIYLSFEKATPKNSIRFEENSER